MADAPANPWGGGHCEVCLSSIFRDLHGRLETNHIFLAIRVNGEVSHGIESNICSYSYDRDRLVLDHCPYESVTEIQTFVERCLRNIHPHHQLSRNVLRFLKDGIVHHLLADTQGVRAGVLPRLLLHVDIDITVRDEEAEDEYLLEMLAGNHLDNAGEILFFDDNRVVSSDMPKPQLVKADISKEKKGKEKGGETCSVCLQDMIDDNVVETTCSHRFHENCIHKWLERRRHCPLCRSKI